VLIRGIQEAQRNDGCGQSICQQRDVGYELLFVSLEHGLAQLYHRREYWWRQRVGRVHPSGGNWGATGAAGLTFVGPGPVCSVRRRS
jgi:hypothetical protein